MNETENTVSPSDRKARLQLTILGIGCAVFLILFVILCIYSRKNEVDLFISKPLCFVPFFLLGIPFGLFFGIDPELKKQTGLLFKMFFKLLIGITVFEIIRAIATFGSSALLALLQLVAEDSDGDAEIIGYCLINLFITTPILLIAMFIGRAVGGALSVGKQEN